MISIIVATSKNYAIGKDNKLLWHIPEDLKRFKSLTTNHVVVMGRKTHQSIGKCLPNRTNVIITRGDTFFKPFDDNCLVINSVDEVLHKFKHKDIFVIGGGEIYKQFLPFASKIIWTLVDKHFDGDSYFEIPTDGWVETSNSSHESNGLVYKFIDLTRK